MRYILFKRKPIVQSYFQKKENSIILLIQTSNLCTTRVRVYLFTKTASTISMEIVNQGFFFGVQKSVYQSVSFSGKFIMYIFVTPVFRFSKAVSFISSQLVNDKNYGFRSRTDSMDENEIRTQFILSTGFSSIRSRKIKIKSLRKSRTIGT